MKFVIVEFYRDNLCCYEYLGYYGYMGNSQLPRQLWRHLALFAKMKGQIIYVYKTSNDEYWDNYE
jgi:hypothetical protein